MSGKMKINNNNGKLVVIENPDTNNTNITIDGSQIVTKSGSVTDNSVPRFDGTTGQIQNSGVTIDDNGNVGIGATPSAWGSINKTLEVGNQAGIISINGRMDGANGSSITQNAYRDSSNAWRYKANGYAQLLEISVGTYNFFTAPSGTAGNTITWTNAMTLDQSGKLTINSPTGAIGYGTGAGGTVTQLTSKSTAVTLNKPSGLITMNNAALAAGASVQFRVYNNLITAKDVVVLNLSASMNGNKYSYRTCPDDGHFTIGLTNVSASSIAEEIAFNFTIIKGAVS